MKQPHRTILVRKTFLLLLTLALSIVALAGCGGSDQENAVKSAVKTYTNHAMTGNWKALASESTGEQLGVLMLLQDQLTSTKFDAKVRLLEVLSTKVHDDKSATAVVHVVRDMNVPDYGTVTDDRQILYHLYNIDGKWKVYRMDVVLQQ